MATALEQLGYDSFLVRTPPPTNLEQQLYYPYGRPLSDIEVAAALGTRSISLPATSLAQLSSGEDLQSEFFVTGSAGWQIQGNGDVEFNQGIFRGAIGGTFTAGQAITAGQVLYFKTSTQRVMPCLFDGADYEHVTNIIGFALADAASGASVKVQFLIGILTTSGLTAGTIYYVSGTSAGAISSTPGAFVGRLGVATSTTALEINYQFFADEFTP